MKELSPSLVFPSTELLAVKCSLQNWLSEMTNLLA